MRCKPYIVSLQSRRAKLLFCLQTPRYTFIWSFAAERHAMLSNNDNSSQNERRRHTRHPISKPVRTRAKTREHTGKTKDISGSGVAIEPNAEMDHDGQVKVEIEDVGTFSGRVSRSSEEDELYAVTFDFDKDEQKRLIADLTEIHNGIIREEN